MNQNGKYGADQVWHVTREELKSMNQNGKYGGDEKNFRGSMNKNGQYGADQDKPLLPQFGTLDRLCPLPRG